MRVLLISTALLLGAYAHADTIETKGGDRLTGKVTGITGGKVNLATDYAGTIAIDLAQIVNVTTDSDLVADTASGQRVSGRLQGTSMVASSAPVAISEVAVAASDAATLDAGKGWKSRADASMNVTTGNTDTRAYGLRAESVLARKESRHLINAALNNAENNGDKTRDEINAGYEYNWLFADQWYFAANAGYFRDKLKDVGYRITAGVGLGYVVYDTPTGRLAVDAGVTGVFEELDGEKEQNPAFRWGLNFNQYIVPDTLEAFHKHSILALADSDRGQIFDSSSGLRLHVSENLDATATIDVRYETEPAPGRDKTDTTYALGVGYRF